MNPYFYTPVCALENPTHLEFFQFYLADSMKLIKRHQPLEENLTNLDSILKKILFLPTKVHMFQSEPKEMYGCELDFKESIVPKN